MVWWVMKTLMLLAREFLLSSSASRTYKLARQPTTAIIMVAILSTRLTVGET